MKIGSLCTGYGGLDMAVEAYFDAETAWVSEIDKPASQLIKARINKPNLGNLKIIDWANVEPIDIITAGYPCQPFSHAGNRKGADDERHLWPYIKTAISILRPRFVVLENVRGHFGLGFGDVLSDLAHIGYNARWTLVRASDVGAPHRRERLFIVAYPSGSRWTGTESGCISSAKSRFARQDSNDKFTDSNGVSFNDARRANRNLSDEAGQIINRPDRAKPRDSLAIVPNSDNGGRLGHVQGLQERYDPRRPMHMQTVPAPLEQGRLNVEFVEYMMGLPKGWVTDVGLSRAQQLKILGNGVVPQQAYYALQLLLGQ
jgi:DNA (cytosine-5)-methyltransferase 1